ncbi:ATP-binding protein [Actinoplanes derwentensis]|uniref:ATPase family associated with various cellular activities (AAA) n=1 Tax=Actinoplanes derwentensis TaxID=113562 RepID=A0A1H1ZZN4_9ACTN|nr:AAA family ATPase [Actinoplanes derwentensis]GID83476.1 cell division control protein 48 CDC48 [Actinoplanes derwentensis]SDT38706.1 ATPase family associated with various cellular activities (AAA) [Actinoplanes derwentensis]
MSDALINSLAAAVEARPDDLTLRLHLAEMLVAAGRGAEAIGHAAQILAREPGNTTAQQLMSRALGGPAPVVPQSGPEEETPPATVPASDAGSADLGAGKPGAGKPVDWAAMEEQFGDVVPPRFARGDGEPDPVRGTEDRVFDVERPPVTLADVGGMTDVKKRLEVSFLGPLRNPKMRSLFGKSLRGGLLLYGPPGCGKTFLARAVAGEMGASFISLSITDVLNMWIGSSERNLHDLFESARGHSPCVLFLDEIDALGHKRSQLQSSMRTVVNQLLTELDGVDGGNDGVFVLAATNAPWDVDSALRRPGRLDRTVLVLPPDRPARAAILEYHLRDRPVAGIDLDAVAAATEHHSGADLAHLCETAAEYAMRDSIASGEIRMINQADMLAAAKEVRPSTDAWFSTARNVAMFANESGEYDDLAAYLKKRKIR